MSRKTFKGSCYGCGKEIEQRPDGSGAMQISIMKWFTSLERYPTAIPICDQCFSKVANTLNFGRAVFDRIHEQEPSEE